MKLFAGIRGFAHMVFGLIWLYMAYTGAVTPAIVGFSFAVLFIGLAIHDTKEL